MIPSAHRPLLSSFILSGCSSASLAPCALPWMAPYCPKKITQPLAKHLTWLPQTFLASFPFLLPCMVLPDSGGRWLVNMPGDATGSHTPKSERRALTMRLRQRPPPTPRHRHPCSSLCLASLPPVLHRAHPHVSLKTPHTPSVNHVLFRRLDQVCSGVPTPGGSKFTGPGGQELWFSCWSLVTMWAT